MKELIPKSSKSPNNGFDDENNPKFRSRSISNRIARITHNILQKSRRTKSFHKLPKPEPILKIGDTKSPFSPASTSSQRSKSRKLLTSPFEPRENFENNLYGRFKEHLPIDRLKRFHVPQRIKSSDSIEEKILFGPISSDDGFHDASTWVLSDGSSSRKHESIHSFDEPSIHSFTSDTLDSISTPFSSRPETTKTPIIHYKSENEKNEADLLVLSLPLSLPNLKIQDQSDLNANPMNFELDKEMLDLNKELSGNVKEVPKKSLEDLKNEKEDKKEKLPFSSGSGSSIKLSETFASKGFLKSTSKDSSKSHLPNEHKPLRHVVNKEKFTKLKENSRTKCKSIHERLRLAYKPESADQSQSISLKPKSSSKCHTKGSSSKLGSSSQSHTIGSNTVSTTRSSDYIINREHAHYSRFERPSEHDIRSTSGSPPLKHLDTRKTHSIGSSSTSSSSQGSDFATHTHRRKVSNPLENAARTLFPNAPSRREIWRQEHCGPEYFYEDPELLEQANDHIRKNAIAVIRMPRKVPVPRYIDHSEGTSRLLIESGLVRHYVNKPTYGKVPSYIEERKRVVMRKLQMKGDGDTGSGNELSGPIQSQRFIFESNSQDQTPIHTSMSEGEGE